MRVCEYVCACACAALLGARAAPAASDDAGFDYPRARRDEGVVDDYHGVKIRDPYRWLEDSESKETKKFIEAENNITLQYLNACPEMEHIIKLLKEVWVSDHDQEYERHGDRYFHTKNLATSEGLDPLILMQESLEGENILFYDAPKRDPESPSKTGYWKAGDCFSKDGSTYAVSLTSTGSDWEIVNFKDVATTKFYPEVLRKVKNSYCSFTIDGKGFFYSGYVDELGKTDGTETNLVKNQKLYYHRLNTSQSEDVVVAEFPDEPLSLLLGKVSDDGRYLIVNLVRAAGNGELHVADLSRRQHVSGKLPLRKIAEGDYKYVTNDGSTGIFSTDMNAANRQVVKMDLQHPGAPETLVPENKLDSLEVVEAVDNDKLVIQYNRNVKAAFQVHDLKTGKFLQHLEVEAGKSVLVAANKDQPDLFINIITFFNPAITYYVDFASPPPYTPKVITSNKIKAFNASLFETKQIFYSSKDGTRIPMYIFSKKDLARNGETPVLLNGYGGFGDTSQSAPSFHPTLLAFVLLGGAVAIPTIRGGGEYGQKWHDAGRALNKQNSFDDFLAAAEYLIAENYTRPGLLTIQGDSNGGLLVAACVNQRPELFGAAIVNSGVTDMLRFHKFTVGYWWIAEYGDPDDSTHFDYLLKYSPLHNIQPLSNEGKQYPATLVTTSLSDNRVVPLHALKYIAALQHARPRQRRPLLARVYASGGHNVGSLESFTETLCFIIQALKLKVVK